MDGREDESETKTKVWQTKFEVEAELGKNQAS